MFKVDSKAAVGGTHLQGYFNATYSELVDAFGEPEIMNNYKVSTEWAFSADNGAVFTLYDYKDTNLYSRELPSPEAFRLRHMTKEYGWHLGAHDKKVFDLACSWLNERLNKKLNKK
jgi:hypothetical protein